MYLQTSSTLIPNEVIKSLFDYLYGNFSEEQIADLLEISRKDCELGRKRGALNFNSFSKVKEKCGFSYANLYHKGLDHECIKAKLDNSGIFTPKRYLNSSYSSKRTSHSILANTSPSIVQDAFKFLQIDGEEFYSESSINQKISTVMNSDLLEYLAECHLLNEDSIYRLGQSSGFYNLKLPFGQAFKGFTLKESFARVIEEIIMHFETSFEYKLTSLTDNKAVIRKYLSGKMKDECHGHTYSNQYLCKYIQGSFSAVALYTTGKLARTTEEKCIFRGHEYCEYHIHLNELSSHI